MPVDRYATCHGSLANVELEIPTKDSRGYRVMIAIEFTIIIMKFDDFYLQFFIHFFNVQCSQ